MFFIPGLGWQLTCFVERLKLFEAVKMDGNALEEVTKKWASILFSLKGCFYKVSN